MKPGDVIVTEDGSEHAVVLSVSEAPAYSMTDKMVLLLDDVCVRKVWFQAPGDDPERPCLWVTKNLRVFVRIVEEKEQDDERSFAKTDG